jgi:hypothetical protein
MIWVIGFWSFNIWEREDFGFFFFRFGLGEFRLIWVLLGFKN